MKKMERNEETYNSLFLGNFDLIRETIGKVKMNIYNINKAKPPSKRTVRSEEKE